MHCFPQLLTLNFYGWILKSKILKNFSGCSFTRRQPQRFQEWRIQNSKSHHPGWQQSLQQPIHFNSWRIVSEQFWMENFSDTLEDDAASWCWFSSWGERSSGDTVVREQEIAWGWWSGSRSQEEDKNQSASWHWWYWPTDFSCWWVI